MCSSSFWSRHRLFNLVSNGTTKEEKTLTVFRLVQLQAWGLSITVQICNSIFLHDLANRSSKQCCPKFCFKVFVETQRCLFCSRFKLKVTVRKFISYMAPCILRYSNSEKKQSLLRTAFSHCYFFLYVSKNSLLRI